MAHSATPASSSEGTVTGNNGGTVVLASSAPEPATYSLVAGALIGLGLVRRKRHGGRSVDPVIWLRYPCRPRGFPSGAELQVAHNPIAPALRLQKEVCGVEGLEAKRPSPGGGVPG